MRKLGTIFGAMASLIAAGSGPGPVIGGWIQEAWVYLRSAAVGGFAVTLVRSPPARFPIADGAAST